MAGRPRGQEAEPEPDSPWEPPVGTIPGLLHCDRRKVLFGVAQFLVLCHNSRRKRIRASHIRLLRALTGLPRQSARDLWQREKQPRTRNAEEVASHSSRKGWKRKTPSACLWGPLIPTQLLPRPEALLHFTFRKGCTCQEELWKSSGSKQRLDLEGHMLETAPPVRPETSRKHRVRMCDGLGWVHCLVGWEGPCVRGVGSDREGASTLGVELGSCPPCAMWRSLWNSHPS